MEPSKVVQEVVATLLGQGFTGRLSSRSYSPVLVTAWLVFTFIMGTTYRGNLTAYLTLPKYPPPPEDLHQLVKAVDKVTMDDWGMTYKEFFIESESSVFIALGRLMVLGVDIVDGLHEESLENKQAHVGDQQYIALTVAQNFTQIDGTSRIYIVREMIVSSCGAWPVPHDATYKPALDRCIMALTEAGLYEYWRKEMLSVPERERRKKQQEALKQDQEKHFVMEEAPGDDSLKALTLVHMQAPLLLLVLGLGAAGVVFSRQKMAPRILSL